VDVEDLVVEDLREVVVHPEEQIKASDDLWAIQQIQTPHEQHQQENKELSQTSK
jgi:hypothetical protein